MLMKLSATSSPSRRVIMFVPSATFCVFFYGVALLISSRCGLSQEAGILLQIKESLEGGGGTDFLADWSNSSASSDFCKWQGVKCISTSTSSNVISLALPSRNLSGHLSSMIGKLSRLEELDLSGNRLHGHVPPELGNCTRLQTLRLSNNFFSGVIPLTLVNCSLLTFLDLSSNNISGFIIPQLGELSNLSELLLYANNLSGVVPASLGKLANLQVLRVGLNSFTSFLPPEIGNCTKLTSIGFASCNLKGTIPWEIGKLQRLEMLNLYDNQLNGFIPSSIGNCRALQKFVIYKNNIQGPIPREFGLLRGLQFLWVYKNLLSGDLPAELGNMSMLQEIDASSNDLVGRLPEEVGGLKSLSFLSLAYNNLSGTVPPSLGNLTSLKILDLGENRLSGTLPDGIGFLPNLTELYISRNILEGQLPAALGTFSDLEILDAYSNRLSGEYPPGLYISKLSALYYLELSFNSIHGEIPAELGQLDNLTNLILSGNNLTGAIPPQIGDLTNLGRLNLSNNKLSGNIPSQVGTLMNLEDLDLSRNSLDGSIPQNLGNNFSDLFILKLSSNNLSGNIPASLGDCSSLIELDLSRNQLEGPIPREIGKLVNLQTALDLSWNRLSGSLPPEIGNLVVLESLDVSYNQLSGQIPPAFSGLQLLSKFNFSFNRFTGRIPALKAFAGGAASSFDGNDALCGPPTPNSCLETRNSIINNKSEGTGSMVGIVIAGVAAITLVIIGRVYYRSRSQVATQGEELKKEEDMLSGSFPEAEVDIGGGYKHRISYQEILTATEEFSDNYLIGSGSFGRVYKVLLREAEKSLAIAAKVLRLQEEGKSSLIREIEALKFVRHRNIVGFLGFVYGSSINMDVLLFEYMAKGSLGEALKSQNLGWKIRLNIALGVAQALKYLHHDCTPQIVHRDLKSANILLDDEYVAHVADFGLAKLIYSDGQSTSSSVYVGSHGYMAPECGYGVRSSPKQDVFSFGVVLLELVTGKAAVVDAEGGGGESRGLAEWVAMIKKNKGNVVLDLIDPELLNDYEKWGDEIEKVIEISLLCTRSSPRERPSMRTVVNSLSSPSPMLLEYASV
ncbi:probable leucine-rich repeat receptor-like protein kinase At5g63930 isoform X2 [Cryptomeria japonica]|uniref:probable leucine-rich repeat receptor-like protein kinase At5g63930 isoform X2 n=1 Tax=Cryptomeria japonica TaxID=3369 RepID=UPI0027DA070A|nr:probable leucine-rich repeat receptor-like protein kinase At5g63930 isoform X2 [Cryptomeria japonica]